jgi:RNA polymerase sigma-70 factor (ECF subfamily)
MFSDENGDALQLARVASGHRDALAALYDTYAGVLLAVCQAILGPSSEAEELLHDVFLHVWRTAGRYQRRKGSVRAWLILKCRQLALEQLRLAPELGCQGQSQTLLPSDWAPPSRFRPLALRDPKFGHERGQVQHALHQVPLPLRQVAEAHFFCGLTLDEMAQANNLSREEAAARVSRAYTVVHHRLHAPRGD